MFVGNDNDSVNEDEDVGINNKSDLEGEELSLAGSAYSIPVFEYFIRGVQYSISYLQLLSDLGQKPYPASGRSLSHKQLHIFQVFKSLLRRSHRV